MRRRPPNPQLLGYLTAYDRTIADLALAHAQHINLGFPQGATLPDPSRVLVGEGKAMRHIQFKSMSDLERPFVRRYIQAAIEQVGAAAAAGGTGKTVVKTTAARKPRRAKA